MFSVFCYFFVLALAFCISVFYYLCLFLHSAFLHSASCIFAFMLYVVRARHFYVCCACVFLGVVSALCFPLIILFFLFSAICFCSCIQYLHFVFLYFALLYLLPRWLCVVSVLSVVARDCVFVYILFFDFIVLICFCFLLCIFVLVFAFCIFVHVLCVVRACVLLDRALCLRVVSAS